MFDLLLLLRDTVLECFHFFIVHVLGCGIGDDVQVFFSDQVLCSDVVSSL